MEKEGKPCVVCGQITHKLFSNRLILFRLCFSCANRITYQTNRRDAITNALRVINKNQHRYSPRCKEYKHWGVLSTKILYSEHFWKNLAKK